MLRIFQLMGWQVRKRAVGLRSRIETLPSVATPPDRHWASKLCRVWGGRDGWLTLALAINCCSRQLLGWQLPRSGKAVTAAAALEQALIPRFGTLGLMHTPFLPCSDNAQVFTSRKYTQLVRSYWLPANVHRPALPTAERHRRPGDPHAQGTMHAHAPLPNLAAHQPRNRQLDPVLQPPAPTPGAGHDVPCQGLCFSGLTCAETARSLQTQKTKIPGNNVGTCRQRADRMW